MFQVLRRDEVLYARCIVRSVLDARWRQQWRGGDDSASLAFGDGPDAFASAESLAMAGGPFVGQGVGSGSTSRCSRSFCAISSSCTLTLSAADARSAWCAFWQAAAVAPFLVEAAAAPR